MKKAIFVTAMLLGLGAATPPAHALGCLSGAAAGALAGHMAGHGVLGAVGGCIAGRTWRNHSLRQQDLQSPDAYDTRRRQFDSSYQSPYRQ